MSTRLGELLVRRGLLTAAQLTKATEEQASGTTALGVVLVKLGFLNEADLAGCLQKEYHLSLVDPSAMNIPTEVIRLIPSSLVTRHHVIPISFSGSSLTVAMSDPSNLVAINEVKFLTGYDVKVAVACVSSITAAIEPLLRGGRQLRRRAHRARQRGRRAGRQRRRDRPQRAGTGHRGRAGRPAGECDPHQRHQATRQRRALGALRAHVPRALPRRRRARRDHAAAPEAEERDHLARQGHGVARHRRAPPAAGRPHQAEARAAARRWTSASRSCRRSSARRSCCGSSTSRTCSST